MFVMLELKPQDNNGTIYDNYARAIVIFLKIHESSARLGL